jgi:hypothetical protein
MVLPRALPFAGSLRLLTLGVVCCARQVGRGGGGTRLAIARQT